jgi:hypothetical protein
MYLNPKEILAIRPFGIGMPLLTLNFQCLVAKSLFFYDLSQYRTFKPSMGFRFWQF